MAEIQSITQLLTDEIKDLYSAERQLLKALPKMAKGAHHPALQKALQAHLQETERQVERLEKAADLLAISPRGKKCRGMEGVLEEGAEALDQQGQPDVCDLGLIGAGSRVEHYEMSGYRTAIALSKALGKSKVVALLQTSLAEEEAAEKKLRSLALALLPAAIASQKPEHLDAMQAAAARG